MARIPPGLSVDEMYGILKRRLPEGVSLTEDLRRARGAELAHERERGRRL